MDLLLLFGGYATVFLVSPKRNGAGGVAGAAPGSLARSTLIGRGRRKVRRRLACRAYVRVILHETECIRRVWHRFGSCPCCVDHVLPRLGSSSPLTMTAVVAIAAGCHSGRLVLRSHCCFFQSRAYRRTQPTARRIRHDDRALPGARHSKRHRGSFVHISLDMQGVDPYSVGGGGGGGGGGTLGGAQTGPSRAPVGAAGGEGLDDLSLSSVSSTLASFFLFLAILRYTSTYFVVAVLEILVVHTCERFLVGD